jgi:beta-glucosidase
VYVGAAPSSSVALPAKALAGFTKVQLAEGESKRVTVDLPARAFSYWSVTQRRWMLIPDARLVMVGGSSADLPLTGSVRMIMQSVESE